MIQPQIYTRDPTINCPIHQLKITFWPSIILWSIREQIWQTPFPQKKKLIVQLWKSREKISFQTPKIISVLLNLFLYSNCKTEKKKTTKSTPHIKLFLQISMKAMLYWLTNPASEIAPLIIKIYNNINHICLLSVTDS